jgi:hypothetical protein
MAGNGQGGKKKPRLKITAKLHRLEQA